MSWHTKHFKVARPTRPDTRPGGPTEVPERDPKRPGGNSGRRASKWTRQPLEAPRPGRPGAR